MAGVGLNRCGVLCVEHPRCEEPLARLAIYIQMLCQFRSLMGWFSCARAPCAGIYVVFMIVVVLAILFLPADWRL